VATPAGIATLGAERVSGLAIGARVGVPWLGATCGVCPYCRDGRENLCDRPLFTGYTRDGGFATHTVADARYCFALPQDFDDAGLAPAEPYEKFAEMIASRAV
jgi:alcohol dehydrogenase, propanol-preferring